MSFVKVNSIPYIKHITIIHINTTKFGEAERKKKFVPMHYDGKYTQQIVYTTINYKVYRLIESKNEDKLIILNNDNWLVLSNNN